MNKNLHKKYECISLHLSIVKKIIKLQLCDIIQLEITYFEMIIKALDQYDSENEI